MTDLMLFDVRNTTTPEINFLRKIIKNKGGTIRMIKNKSYLRYVVPDMKNLSTLQNIMRGRITMLVENMKISLSDAIPRYPPNPIYYNSGEYLTQRLVIPAGDTGFGPGPLLKEFQNIGGDTKLEKGKIHLKTELIMGEKGDKIDRKNAEFLKKIDLPMRQSPIQPYLMIYQGQIFSEELSIFSHSFFDTLTQIGAQFSNFMANAEIFDNNQLIFRINYFLNLSKNLSSKINITEK